MLDKRKKLCYNSKAQRKVSSVGRASALQAEGHRFEPCTFHQGKSLLLNGLVAQLVRALACHARGRGFEPHPSRHFRKTQYADLAHLVERDLAKVEVAGSSPVIRSIRKARV